MHTATRSAYQPARIVLADLQAWLKDNDAGALDYVTLGGAGEPCLNSELGEIITGVKSLVPRVPVAVLTNSCLLGDPQVARELIKADVILPSLDSLVPEEFWRINRPCVKLRPQEVADHLLRFARDFSGSIFLEVLLVQGVNDSQRNLELLHAYCRTLQAQRVDVLSMTRPGAYSLEGQVDAQVLAHWREILNPGHGEGQAAGRPSQRFQPCSGPCDVRDLPSDIVASLQRRPQTRQQLTEALGAEDHLVAQTLDTLLREEILMHRTMKGQTYYLFKHFEPDVESYGC